MTEESAPTKMEEVDKLKLKCAWSEMVNVQLQIRVLRGDLLQAEKLLQQKLEELKAVRDGIAKRYGIDPNVTTIDDDGNFVPVTPEMRATIAANAPMMRF